MFTSIATQSELCGGNVAKNKIIVIIGCCMPVKIKHKTKGENIMENQNKYLLLARRAREEDNAEDAKKYYDIVRTEDPDNAEAKFFYSYYHMYSGKVGDAVHNYLSLCKGIDSTLKMIVASESTAEEKKAFIKAILNCTMKAYDTAESAYYKVNTGSIVEIRSAYDKAVKTTIGTYTDNFGEDEELFETNINIKLSKLVTSVYDTPFYNLGDEIESKYSSNPELMAKAIDIWKTGIDKGRKMIYIADPSGKAKRDENIAKYGAKIQKYDPTYVVPVPKEGFLDKLIKKISSIIGKK